MPQPPRTRRHFPGFPKKLPCLICGRSRRAQWPGDRLHSSCQKERDEQVAHEYRLTHTTYLQEDPL